MKLRALSVAAISSSLGLFGVNAEAQRMDKDWFNKMLDSTMISAENFLAGEDEDPCMTAVKSILKENEPKEQEESVLASLLESLSIAPCRGEFGMFTEAQVEECLAIQSSPEVQEMIDEGITQPFLVCGWRQFWTQSKSNELSNNHIDSCELCQRTTEMIEDTLKKEKLEVQLIQKGLEILCQYLPESTKCKVLEKRFDDIVDWIKEGFSPKNICLKIKLCPASKPHYPKPLDVQQVEQLPVVKAEKDNNVCSICRDNGRIMQQFAGTPHGLELYKTGIQSVCRLAPEATSCRFMTQNFDALADKFNSGLSVDAACAQVNACGGTKDPTLLSCAFCKYSAGIVASALQQGGPDVLPVVKKGLDIMCGALPAQTQCDVLDTNFDKLAELLQAGKSPEYTCEKIQMCAPTQQPNRFAMVPYSLSSPDMLECLLCEYTAQVITRVAQYSQDFVPLVKQGMEILCSQVPEPDFQTECNAVVKVFDDLASLIEGGSTASAACQKVHLCDGGLLPKAIPPSKALQSLEAKVTTILTAKTKSGANDEIGCLFCQYTGEMIQQVGLYSKDMVPLVKQGLELLCDRIQIPEFQKECKAVTDKFDQIAKLIDGGSTPQDACKKVKLCDAGEKIIPDTQSEAEMEAKILNIIEADSVNDVPGDIECVFCEYTAEEIRRIGGYSEVMVPLFKEGLEVMCSQVKVAQFRVQCLEAVNKFDKLAHLVQKGVSPKKACRQVELCNSKNLITSEMASLEEKVKAVVAGEPIVTDELSCVFCQYTAQVIAQVSVYSKDMVPLVKQGMEALCGQIQIPEFQNKCNAVVNNFDKLAALIEGGTGANEACRQVKLCDNRDSNDNSDDSDDIEIVSLQLAKLETKVLALEATPNDIVGCLLCEYTGEVIVQVASFSQDLVPLVKEGLDLVCSRVQSESLQQECKSVLGKFDQIAELIEKGATASQACSKVVLCAIKPPSPLEQHVANLIAHPESVTSAEGCTFCKYAVASIETVMQLDKKDLPVLREAIATMCTFLPPEAECDKVNENFEEIVAMLENGSGVQASCEKIGVCTKRAIVKTVEMEQAPDDVFDEIDLVPKSCLSDKPRGFFERLSAASSKYSLSAGAAVSTAPEVVIASAIDTPTDQDSSIGPQVIIHDSPTKSTQKSSNLTPLDIPSTPSLFLYITVIGATNLLKVHKFGVQAPYLELKISSEDSMFRTAEYKKGGSEAHWNQSFTRHLSSLDDTMQIAAKASTTVIGEAFVSFRSLNLSSAPLNHVISLSRDKLTESAGSIELQMRLVDAAPSPCPVAPLPMPSPMDKPVEPKVSLTNVKYNDVSSDTPSAWDAPVRKGTLMYKIPYHAKASGMPKRKWVAVDDIPKRGLCIMWTDPEKTEKQWSHTIPMRDIVEVKTGIKTQAFRRQHAASSKTNTFFHEDSCFSLISASRSLDLAATSKDEAQLWVTCLRKMLQQESASSSMATKSMTDFKVAATTPRDPAPRVKNDHTTWLKQLFAAAKQNKLSEIANYLMEGCPVDLLEPETGDTILFLACRHGNVPLLELCLKWGAKNDPHPTFGDTALQIAVKASQPECVRQLLSIAAKSDMDTEIVNHVDHANQAPLHVAAAQGDLICLQYLLHHGADICVVQNNGFTPLHCAVLAGHEASVRYILDVGGDAIINTGDSQGNTPLHCAISIENEALVKLLLESAADVTVENTEGLTPFRMARKNNLRAIQALLATYEPEPVPVKEPPAEIMYPQTARVQVRDALAKQRSVSPCKSLSARSNSTYEGDYDGYTSSGSASTSPSSSHNYSFDPHIHHLQYNIRSYSDTHIPTASHSYYTSSHHQHYEDNRYNYPQTNWSQPPQTEWDTKYTTDGHVYYVNNYTGVSQWECPPALQTPMYPQAYEYTPPPPIYDSRSQYIRAQLATARQPSVPTLQLPTALNDRYTPTLVNSTTSPATSPKTSFSQRRKMEGLSVITALPPLNVGESIPTATSSADTDDIFQRSRSKSPKGKSKTVKLLDVKRSNNVIMTLSDFEIHAQYEKVVQAIIDMDESVFNLEKLRCLKTLFPTDEEKKSLLNYTGDTGDFGKAEKFMMACLKVDNIHNHADCFLFKLKFMKSITNLRSRVDLIMTISRSILGNTGLTSLIQQILEDKRSNVTWEETQYKTRFDAISSELSPAQVDSIKVLKDLPDLSLLVRSELQEALDLLVNGLRQCQTLLSQSKQPTSKSLMALSAIGQFESFIKESVGQLNDVSEDFSQVKKWETKLVTEFGVVLEEFNPQEIFRAVTKLIG
ncbi:hypothetical protein THRCLA_08171 [Thraustotheca clavata]|uniref:Secreted protein n=1 Tax=Thraustotheca clavata TaxID=74557 RepID=A0A1V9Z943_9STRA|nr:hypothetical protein THRCLA_08171 [Thraustotheca clavata]